MKPQTKPNKKDIKPSFKTAKSVDIEPEVIEAVDDAVIKTIEDVHIALSDGEKDFVKPEEEDKVPEKLLATTDVSTWVPKTSLGKKVKSGEIKDLAEILDSGQSILEAEIVDVLLPGIESDLLMIGQSKGKFGGGQRRVFKQTQKKTKEGNKPHFATLAVVGNRNGYIGIGYGKSKETVPSREKALRNAKLNMIKIRRGSGSWESDSFDPTSIPFSVSGRCSGVRLKLIPAPKGTGLCIEKECKKMLELAGIKDVRSKTQKRRTKLNLIKACFDALKNLSKTKVTDQQRKTLGITEGKVEVEEAQSVVSQ